MTVSEALKSNNILKNAAPASLATLASASSIKQYKKGKHIFHDRDDADALYGVIDGTVALYTTSSSGEKRGIFIYGNHTMLNEDIVDGKPEPLSAAALRDSGILCIKKNTFFKVCAQDSALSRAVMESMAHKIRRLYHIMKNTSNNVRGDRRIASKLWKLSCDHGIETARGCEINFDLSIKQLAEFLGSQRETVSRQVKTLGDAGLLIFENNRFTIPDREKLLDFFENTAR